MREVSFVKQNKEKWIGFENALGNNVKINPDDLASYYIQLTNDLSYAQTYYPESKTLLYLNSLASQAHQKIYITKKESKNKIISFWRDEFPLFFYQYQKTLLYAFLIFMAAVSMHYRNLCNCYCWLRRFSDGKQLFISKNILETRRIYERS